MPRLPSMAADDLAPATPPRRWHLEVPADPSNVASVRSGVTDFARRHGAGDEAIADIALAVTEAATNAVVHAFVGRDPGTLTVVAEPGPESLLVRVADDGRGMVPRSDSPGLGLGLPLMAQLTVSCDFRDRDDREGTEVRMVFAAPGIVAPPTAPADEDWKAELLAEVGGLAGYGWPGESVQRLVDLLVPRLADACAVDVLDGDGNPRRLTARIDSGADSAELSGWLAARVPREDQMQALLPDLRNGQVRVFELDDATSTALARDEGEARVMARVELAFWVVVPLRDGEQLLGELGIGLRANRDDPREQVDFWQALGTRAGRGLANTQLVDELRRTRRRLERILGALAEAVTVQDDAGHMVYANDAAARLLGADSVEEVLAASPGELAERFLITREDGEPVTLEDLPSYRLLAGGTAATLLTRSVHRRTGVARWLLTKAAMLDDDGVLVVNIIEDVTEAKDAERRQRFLVQAGDLLASTVDYARTLEHVARLAVPTLADWCAVDVLSDDGTLQRLATAHVDPDKLALGRRMHRDYPPDLSAEAGIAAVVRGGPAELYPLITDEMLAASAADDEQLQLLREIGMRSVMIVPMRVEQRTLGVLTFVSAESGREFDGDDLAFAGELARRAALAVETARLFAQRE